MPPDIPLPRRRAPGPEDEIFGRALAVPFVWRVVVRPFAASLFLAYRLQVRVVGAGFHVLCPGGSKHGVTWNGYGHRWVVCPREVVMERPLAIDAL